MAWVAAYEGAWRGRDTDAVERLFTDDAQWRQSPYEPTVVGHAGIRALWDDDRPFTMEAAPVAVEGENAVVRLTVRYDAPEQEYQDLWVLRFAPDGRVAEYEEWPYWPGRGYVATA